MDIRDSVLVTYIPIITTLRWKDREKCDVPYFRVPGSNYLYNGQKSTMVETFVRYDNNHPHAELKTKAQQLLKDMN